MVYRYVWLVRRWERILFGDAPPERHLWTASFVLFVTSSQCRECPRLSYHYRATRVWRHNACNWLPLLCVRVGGSGRGIPATYKQHVHYFLAYATVRVDLCVLLLIRSSYAKLLFAGSRFVCLFFLVQYQWNVWYNYAKRVAVTQKGKRAGIWKIVLQVKKTTHL